MFYTVWYSITRNPLTTNITGVLAMWFYVIICTTCRLFQFQTWLGGQQILTNFYKYNIINVYILGTPHLLIMIKILVSNPLPTRTFAFIARFFFDWLPITLSSTTRGWSGYCPWTRFLSITTCDRTHSPLTEFSPYTIN